MKQTFYAHAQEGSQQLVDVAAVNWSPLNGCRDWDDAAQTAAGRFLRNRGDIQPGEAVDFCVLIRDTLKLPGVVRYYDMTAKKQGGQA
jgi:hypothetical protein